MPGGVGAQAQAVDLLDQLALGEPGRGLGLQVQHLDALDDEHLPLLQVRQVLLDVAEVGIEVPPTAVEIVGPPGAEGFPGDVQLGLARLYVGVPCDRGHEPADDHLVDRPLLPFQLLLGGRGRRMDGRVVGGLGLAPGGGYLLLGQEPFRLLLEGRLPEVLQEATQVQGGRVDRVVGPGV